MLKDRRSRSSSVADITSYLSDEKHTLYRRAHTCHKAASSGTVDFEPFIFNKEVCLRDHRRERRRDPSIGAVVSPKDKESVEGSQSQSNTLMDQSHPKSITDESHSKTVTASRI
jgi:hypothetical protein